ncbi:MAG: lasso peptide biosynthesis B2 protein [Acidobacteriota bacterium]|nr:lasso peptide biosynthesis B2 protein [Acidobacteriota bacterium]
MVKPLRALRMLRTFVRLDTEMKLQLAEALLLPGLIRLGFRTLGVARTQGLLRSWTSHRQRAVQTEERVLAVIAGTRRAQRIVQRVAGVGGTCLVRSFALWAMLRRRGIQSDVRVGMRKTDGRIEGHAWLEYKGRPVNETRAVIATYSALPVPATYDLWLRRLA